MMTNLPSNDEITRFDGTSRREERRCETEVRVEDILTMVADWERGEN
jgi:hypothetical protein